MKCTHASWTAGETGVISAGGLLSGRMSPRRRSLPYSGGIRAAIRRPCRAGGFKGLGPDKAAASCRTDVARNFVVHDFPSFYFPFFETVSRTAAPQGVPAAAALFDEASCGARR
jgi:hypothetical protein